MFIGFVRVRLLTTTKGFNMEFDEETFRVATSHKIPTHTSSCDYLSDHRCIVQQYIKLANQKQANLIDKEVCLLKNDNKARLERIARGCLEAMLKNTLIIEAICEASSAIGKPTPVLLAEDAVQHAKSLIAELDK